MSPRRFGVLAAAVVGLLGSVAEAENGKARATADRVAVRFYSPETGGSTRPRFITERTLAFEARLEAMTEASPEDAFEERYVRAAMERHIAEDMLANLMVERGSEPQDLPRLTDDFRRAITDRVGGADALHAAAAREGIDETEIVDIMRRKVRAAYYVDRAIVPILHPSDEELREAHRTSNHPYKGMKFEDAEQPLRRWMIVERLRISEVAFLQASRSRVRIVPVAR